MQYSTPPYTNNSFNQNVDAKSSTTPRFIPHRGTLRRVHHSSSPSSSKSKHRKSKQRTTTTTETAACSASFVTYVMNISIPPPPSHHSPQEEDEEEPDEDTLFSPPTTTTTPQKEREEYELVFDRQQYEFCFRLFSILDTESHGSINQEAIKEFVDVRCPAFRRRDYAIRNLEKDGDNDQEKKKKKMKECGSSGSPTFDEVWEAVISCSSILPPSSSSNDYACDKNKVELGVEGWMVFCRFIALAQYQEAKRRFSSRHKQQTMRHRHGGRGSEVVVVNVPPPDPPQPISVQVLVEHECKRRECLPLPELDLDHCLVFTHDALNRNCSNGEGGKEDLVLKRAGGNVAISVFGLPSSQITPSLSSRKNSSSHNLEFVLTYTQSHPNHPNDDESNIIVRRSFADMEWLHKTFISHKTPGGGTLCGRILPPFPKISKSSSSSSHVEGRGTEGHHHHMNESSTEIAVQVAKTGVGMITSMAKSLWGSYVSSSSSSPPTPSTFPTQQQQQHQISDTGSVSSEKERVVNSIKKGSSSSSSSSIKKSRDGIIMTSSPSCKARHLQRYLNYLLEHPALSSSFPLNAILKSSQSGLESAKRILEEQSKSSSSTSSQFGKNISQMDHHFDHQSITKMSSLMFWSSSLSSSSPLSSSPPQPNQPPPNMTWVRTAAQAAMALKVHGILETTGCSAASAKLQHASLPNFGSSSQKKGNASWVDEDGVLSAEFQKQEATNNINKKEDGTNNDDCFENGVVSVESELDMCDDEDAAGYDMLPNPVPAPERSVLCAGSSSVVSDETSLTAQSLDDKGISNDCNQPSNLAMQQISQRFRYGVSTSSITDDRASTILGDMAVDDDIDKLREIIGSVDNILGRCLASSAGVGQALRKRNALHLGVVQSIDSWEGMRGEIITQRALLNGVSMLAGSNEVAEECSQTLSEDLSWQASLASSAVSAAEDVRAAVRASRTATRAKAAAESAALTAQKSCENRKFSSVDEARAAQTRASIAQGHAIHSAVVEHEAMAAKRRAALALAHDVKCWNVHRKRELFRTCRAVAQSQLEASRQAVDAWTQLQSGILNSSLVPLTDEKRETHNSSRDEYFDQAEESSTVIYGSSSSGTDGQSPTLIVPVDHVALSQEPLHEDKTSEGVRFSSSNVSTDEFAEEIVGTTFLSMLGEEDENASYDVPRESIVISENHVPTSASLPSEEEKPDVNMIKDESSLRISEEFYGMPAEVTASDKITNEQLIVQGKEDAFGGSSDGAQNFGSDFISSGRNEVQDTPEPPTDPVDDSDGDGVVLSAPDDQPNRVEDSEKSLIKTSSPSDKELPVPVENDEVDSGFPFGMSDSLSDAFQSPRSFLQESCSQKIDKVSTVSHDENDSFHAEGKNEIGAGASIHENNNLTDSMQSLVDGLMTWGGQYDSQDDMTLPAGMAAGIALEESGLLG